VHSKNRRRRLSDQLMLFPPTASLAWTDLPATACHQVLVLLARMLREHRRLQRATEVRDE